MLLLRSSWPVVTSLACVLLHYALFASFGSVLSLSTSMGTVGTVDLVLGLVLALPWLENRTVHCSGRQACRSLVEESRMDVVDIVE